MKENKLNTQKDQEKSKFIVFSIDKFVFLSVIFLDY